MRLTAEVICSARVSINPLKERELDLRGYKIPLIENLGATKDGFDCLDLSDNEIKKLENFPRLKRLRMLLLTNNPLLKIQPHLEEALPQLQVLVLSHCNLTQLTELNCLAPFPQLRNLSLVGSPITKQKHYRQYVIYTLKQLKVLDFHKIKQKERKEVELFFQSALGRKVLDAAQDPNKPNVHQPSQQQVDLIKSQIKNAKSVEEVNHLEKQLQDGKLFSDSTAGSPNKKQKVANGGNTKTTANEGEKMEVDSVPCTPPTTKKRDDPVETNDTEMKETKKEEKKEVTSPEKQKKVAVDSPSKSAISKMRVADLRNELKNRGLSIKGLKAELVERLQSDIYK